MTKLSKAMAELLAMVPDGPGGMIVSDRVRLTTMRSLVSRGLVKWLRSYPGGYRRTPFGRETAEKLARRGEK